MIYGYFIQQFLMLYLFSIKVQNVMKSFEKHYMMFFKGRKLVWIPNYSFVELERKQMVVLANACQATILLLFTERHKIIDESMFRNIIVNDIELKMTLQSLVDSKVLLHTENNSYTVTEPTSSVVDARGALITRKIDAREVNNSARRNTVIKARIVKTLKQMKQMEYSELLSHLAETITSFVPIQSEIDTALETLVEKDYILKKGMQYQYV